MGTLDSRRPILLTVAILSLFLAFLSRLGAFLAILCAFWATLGVSLRFWATLATFISFGVALDALFCLGAGVLTPRTRLRAASGRLLVITGALGVFFGGVLRSEPVKTSRSAS